MKIKCLIILLVVFCNTALFSQDKSVKIEELGIFSDANGSGNIQITMDTKLDAIIKAHIANNEKTLTFPGFRVQIYFGSGNTARTQANNIMADFKKKYPDMEAYLDYSVPYFKVKVGDFRTKPEALFFKQKIEGQFTKAFVVEDMISMPKLD